jgi:hypothetical protein
MLNLILSVSSIKEAFIEHILCFRHSSECLHWKDNSRVSLRSSRKHRQHLIARVLQWYNTFCRGLCRARMWLLQSGVASGVDTSVGHWRIVRSFVECRQRKAFQDDWELRPSLEMDKSVTFSPLLFLGHWSFLLLSGTLPGGCDEIILESRMNLVIGALVKEQLASAGSHYALTQSPRNSLLVFTWRETGNSLIVSSRFSDLNNLPRYCLTTSPKCVLVPVTNCHITKSSA